MTVRNPGISPITGHGILNPVGGFRFIQEVHDFTLPASAQPRLTTGKAVTKGNLLIVWVVSDSSPSWHTIADASNTWFRVQNLKTSYTGERMSIWYAIASRTAVLSIDLFNGNPTPLVGDTRHPLLHPACQLLEFNGSSPLGLDTSAFGSGTGVTPAQAVVSAAVKELIIGFVSANGTLTSGAGWTAAPGAAKSALNYKVQPAAGSVTPPWSVNPSTDWGAVSAAFKPPSSGYKFSGSLGVAGANAQVTITSINTGIIWDVTADASGNFTSPELPADTYMVDPLIVGKICCPYRGVITLPDHNLAFTQSFSDNFNRANENPLANGKWATFGSNGCQIVSNQVEARTANTANTSLWTGDGAIGNDQWAEITINTLTAANGFAVILLRSATSGNQNCYRAYVGQGWLGNNSNAPPTLQIDKYVNGVNTSLFSLPMSVQSGDKLRFAVIGTKLYCYLNGVPVCAPITDNSIASGYPGINIFISAGLTNVIIDNFIGGTVAQGSGIMQGVSPTSFSVNAMLTLTQTDEDTFTRADESPLNATDWAVNGTPVPPWDPPFAVLNNKAVMSDPAIYANYAGPWHGDGVSVFVGTTLVADCWAEIQVDAMNLDPLSWSHVWIAIRSTANNSQAGYCFVWNNWDGTVDIRPIGVLTGTNGLKPPTLGNISYPGFCNIRKVPWVAGDKLGYVAIGNVWYVLKNRTIIGQYRDSTSYQAAPSYAVIGCGGIAQTDVQYSNFKIGSATSS